MKTKCSFTPDDFNGSGQLIVRDSFSRGSPDYDFAITVCYKIGYIQSSSEGRNYGPVMISMDDGRVKSFDTLGALCEYLNDDSIGYRPMTKAEIVKVIGGQGSRFPE